MAFVNIAGAALLIIAVGAAVPATKGSVTSHGHKPKVEKQQTIRIRRDGQTSRPPMDAAVQARLAFENFLAIVNRTYQDLPEEDDRFANQPKPPRSDAKALE